MVQYNLYLNALLVVYLYVMYNLYLNTLLLLVYVVCKQSNEPACISHNLATLRARPSREG